MSIIEDHPKEEYKPLIKYDKPKIVASGVHYLKKQEWHRLLQMEGGDEDFPTEDVLNAILPPREYVKDREHLYIENVLSTPATRMEVVMLCNELDRRLQELGARDCGICPIRESLYSQTFDELIRQVTIKLAHRGLLLVRVRNEFKNFIACYQKLYESSLAYGTRKSLQGQQEKAEKVQKIRLLDETCGRLDRDVRDLELEIKKIEQDHLTKLQKFKESHEVEVQKTKESTKMMKDTISQKLLEKENKLQGKGEPEDDEDVDVNEDEFGE